MSNALHAYDIPTFCNLFGIGRTLAYREIKAGRLKIIKVGRRTLISAVAAQQWLEQLGGESA